MNPVKQYLETLPRESLEDLLAQVVDLCFLDEDEQGKPAYDPDREIGGGDLVEDLLQLLGRTGLIPPPGPRRVAERMARVAIPDRLNRKLLDRRRRFRPRTLRRPHRSR